MRCIVEHVTGHNFIAVYLTNRSPFDTCGLNWLLHLVFPIERVPPETITSAVNREPLLYLASTSPSSPDAEFVLEDHR